MRLISRVRAGLALLDMREFSLAKASCPFCGPSLFVRLNGTDVGIRCMRCAASVVHLSIGFALRDNIATLLSCDACEFSARGPMVAYLRRRARTLAVSEYFADATPGEIREGVRCEDMQQLSYANASFDVITHTEVLEHVPDDHRALTELHRVLRPGGRMLFTVPLHGGAQTIERARVRDGVIEYLQPPVYHTDPLRDEEGILAFRDYGADILELLRAAGFTDVRLYVPPPTLPWLRWREVIIASRT